MLGQVVGRRRALLAAAIATMASAPKLHAEPVTPACAATAELGRLGLPLPHLGRRIAAREAVKIVAIGSSSTAGAGASSSAASYPSRLEAELKARFPQLPIVVLNRGVNGEEAAQMLARFDAAVLAEHPDLVIWQLGTNALIRNTDLEALTTTLTQGLERLKALAADVIVIDPQFVPQVIAAHQTDRMLSLLSTSAKAQHVGLFHRYAVMRYWNEDEHLPFAQFVSADGLHMNDWGYACLAKLLADAIAEAATRIQTAHLPMLQH